jgi:glycerophosphoryl diester phosphodiesterase
MGVLRRLGLASGALALTSAYKRLARPPRRPPARLRMRPLMVGHRGAAGLAPENTLEACRVAVERWGARALEVDVRASGDGVAVLLHDATVDRTTDGTGPVSALPLARLRELDAGYAFASADGDHAFRGRGVRVPTFGELLEACPDALVLVDLKCADAALPLARAIDGAEAWDRVIVAGERLEDRGPLLSYRGPTGLAQEDTARFFAAHHVGLRRFWRPPADVASLPERHRGFRLLTPGVIAGLHERGLVVWVWTVNDASDMRRLLEWGADGIITDRPDLMSGVLRDLGARHADAGAG